MGPRPGSRTSDAPAPSRPTTPARAPETGRGPSARETREAPAAVRPSDLDTLGDDWADEPLDDLDLDRELRAEATPARWVGMAHVLGAALVGIIALQVLFALIEAFMYKGTEPQGVPTDILHRIGYPFGSLGTTALLFLVVGVALLSLPAYFEEETTPAQDRLAGVALGLAAATAVVLALGSLLAVRANFHVYAENDRPVPTYVVVQYVTFLIGNLGTSVAAVYAAVQVSSLRDRR